MENEKQETLLDISETEIGDKKVGDEQPPLEAAKCKIVSLQVRLIKGKKDQTKTYSKLVVNVSHPSGKEIGLSAIKYQKSDKLIEKDLFVNTDDADNIQHNSGIGNLLRFYKCETIKDLQDVEVDTMPNDNGYLIIKAY